VADFKTSAADFGPEGGEEADPLATKPVGEGAEGAEFEWGWGGDIPEADGQTLQEIWDNRSFEVDTSTTGSLELPGGGGGSLPKGAFGGLSEEQSRNARIIIQVGQKRGLSRYAQAIAVMTALGESGLRNLNYGDRDSIGMFQERATWGSVQDRLDPYQTSERFYDRLLGVNGWQKMKPTIAAHKAQVNADPNHYTKWWSQAARVLSAAYGR
jgi:hypothetical protein